MDLQCFQKFLLICLLNQTQYQLDMFTIIIYFIINFILYQSQRALLINYYHHDCALNQIPYPSSALKRFHLFSFIFIYFLLLFALNFIVNNFLHYQLSDSIVFSWFLSYFFSFKIFLVVSKEKKYQDNYYPMCVASLSFCFLRYSHYLLKTAQTLSDLTLIFRFLFLRAQYDLKNNGGQMEKFKQNSYKKECQSTKMELIFCILIRFKILLAVLFQIVVSNVNFKYCVLINLPFIQFIIDQLDLA